MTPGAWVGTQPSRTPAELRHEEWREISGRQGNPVDWALLGLAAISFGLPFWFLYGPRPPSTATGASWYDTLLVTDLVICIIFFVAICVRWLRSRTGRIYLTRHWWEIPALIPFIIPAVNDRPWVMWILLVARAARLADRADGIFGDQFTAALIRHFSDPIVDAIKRPVTVAALDEVADVLNKGTYTTNIRHAIASNRPQIEAMVLELVKQDQMTGKVRYVPFHDELMRTTTDTVLRIVDRALDDPRTAELVSDVIRTTIAQVQESVRERR